MGAGEIILIVLSLAGIVFLSIFLINAFGKKAKKDDKAKPKEEKPVEKSDGKKEDKKEEKKDIPDILKEVTQGNYMYDISHESSDELTEEDIPENLELTEPDTSTVDEAFQRIEAIEDEYSDENLDTQSILDEMDGVSKKDTSECGELDEIRHLSKGTKAILISDILKRKK